MRPRADGPKKAAFPCEFALRRGVGPSILRPMLRLASDTIDAASRERILVVCKKYIGDTVLSIPFLRNLRRGFPDAAIDVFAEGAARDVLDACPHVDEVLEWVRPRRKETGGGLAGGRFISSMLNIESAAARLRAREYTRAYLLKSSLSATALALRAGIPHRVGFASGLVGPLLTRAVRIAPRRHQVEIYLDMLRADGIAVDDGHNENWVAADAASRTAPLLSGLPAGRPRVFVACCGTKRASRWPLDLARRGTSRSWPLGRWAELIHWLVESRGCEVVFCGSRADVPTHERIRAGVGPRLARHVHDFSAAVTSLRETIAVLSRMDLCVGIDTGPVHLAASFGLPVISLFGPSDPNRWAPWTARRAVVRPRHAARDTGGGFAAESRERGIHAPEQEWQPGPPTLEGLSVAAVKDAVAAFLQTGTAVVAPRTIDLRTGGFRYEVIARPATSKADAALVDASVAVPFD